MSAGNSAREGAGVVTEGVGVGAGAGAGVVAVIGAGVLAGVGAGTSAGGSAGICAGRRAESWPGGPEAAPEPARPLPRGEAAAGAAGRDGESAEAGGRVTLGPVPGPLGRGGAEGAAAGGRAGAGPAAPGMGRASGSGRTGTAGVAGWAVAIAVAVGAASAAALGTGRSGACPAGRRRSARAR
jgi:hypothetical protein